MDDLLLQKYLRNETSEEELVEVLDWLDASTENQRYLDRLDYISNLNILAGEAQPRIRRHTVSLWKRTAQWSAAAAAVLLACAGLGHYMADRILERRTRDMMAITAPNDQIDLVDGHLKLNRITDPDDFRWVDGLMNLNTLSFGEVIRKFENYYGVRITIDNPEDMPELKYHGKIRVSDGVDHALKLLQITNNFSYTRDDETNTIHIKITKI